MHLVTSVKEVRLLSRRCLCVSMLLTHSTNKCLFCVGPGNPGGTVVKNLPANAGPWTGSLGWEDPLEQEMATCSSILAWKIPWTEKPGRLQSMGLQRIGHD